MPRTKKQTSLIAFKRILGGLTRRQRQVYTEVLLNPGITLREASKNLKIPVNSLSGRFYELEQAKKIYVDGVKFFDNSNQPHSKWRVKI